MSKTRVMMDRLQELVRLHRKGTGGRKTAKLLKMGRNTERQYREALGQAGLLEGSEHELPPLADLKRAVEEQLNFVSKPKPESEAEGGSPLEAEPLSEHQSVAEKWSQTIKKLFDKGCGTQSIFDTLRLEHADFDQTFWQVRWCWRQLKKEKGIEAKDVAIPVETLPGEIAQVDFGYVGELYSAQEGVLRKAWVFVMVLAFCRHMFCKVVFDQRIQTWLALHVEAFEYFGGVVETVVPDNLKSAVIKAAYSVDTPSELNRSYRELARHYDFKIDPTPVNSPEKKGKVESAVKYVKNNFFKPRKFLDINDSNQRLGAWVKEIAGRRIHGTTGLKPIEVFAEIEKEVLRPLPQKRFEMMIWKKATVHRDSRILFEKILYPVPWRFIGKQVWLHATRLSVEIYCEDVRIAAHQRGVVVAKEIVDTYLPQGRCDLRHRSESFWQNRAAAMGEEVGAYIKEVFEQDDVLSMLRPVQSMVTMLEKYSHDRAQAACKRASFYGNYKYKGLKEILIKALDMVPLPMVVVPKIVLANPRFARNPSELLRAKMEESHEPN